VRGRIPASGAVQSLAAVLVGAGLALLALVGGVDPTAALVVIVAAAAAAVLLRWRLPTFGPLLGTLPWLGALGYLAAVVPVGPATESLAGLTSLALLVWLGLSDADGAQLVRLVGGVLVPGLGFGIALMVSILLPVARQSIGAAAILLLAALGVLAWAVLEGAPEPLASETVPPSL
jgi:hypothetical protein